MSTRPDGDGVCERPTTPEATARTHDAPVTRAAVRTGTMIVVLGMHRSGTSSLSGTLARLGAALPRSLMPTQADNPLGFYESPAIMDFNDALLRSWESRWDDWRRVVIRDEDRRLRDRALALLDFEFSGASLAVIKDPRMCRLLPFWQTVFPQAGYRPVFVIPLRHPLEVARSLEARNRFPLAKGVLLWLRHVLDAERDSRGCPRAFVSWSAFLDDWQGQARQIARRLEISYPEALEAKAEVIAAYLDRSMRHHDAAGEELPGQSALGSWAKATYEALLALSLDDAPLAITAGLDAIEAEFDRASQAFAPLLAKPAPSGSVAAPPGPPYAEPGADEAGRMTAPVGPDPATAFVHACIRKRMRPDDTSLVTNYAAKVFRGAGRQDHTVRALETLRLIQDHGLLCDGMALAETGPLGDVGEHLIEEGHACDWIDGDLRYEFRALSSAYDLLLSLNVVQHIKDQISTTSVDLPVYDASGLKRFAEECWRVIKPGGTLVVTTPNACSLFSLMEMLDHRPPMLWRQNVREYTSSEIVAVFAAAGFQLAYFTTWFAYFYLDPEDIEPLARRYLDPVGASREDRGDSLGFVFTKERIDVRPGRQQDGL